MGIPVFVMGNGTNLLVRDGGIRGLTIHTGDMEGLVEEGDGGETLRPGESVDLSILAGTLLSKVINYSVSRGLSEAAQATATLQATRGATRHATARCPEGRSGPPLPGRNFFPVRQAIELDPEAGR